MLSFTFYTQNGQRLHCIRMAESLYEWLIQSDFAQVGRSQPTTLQLEGEALELPLIFLSSTTRSMFIALFNEMILLETSAMLNDLDHNFSQTTIAPRSYRLKKLIELLTCLKDPEFTYFQRE
ncbi:MAG: hypothetical protein VKJ64_21475 [Leptolyngbyaceae bacterium]|nr:hypothetical protein [Leptolyngbyaceae bacterium]